MWTHKEVGEAQNKQTEKIRETRLRLFGMHTGDLDAYVIATESKLGTKFKKVN